MDGEQELLASLQSSAATQNAQAGVQTKLKDLLNETILMFQSQLSATNKKNDAVAEISASELAARQATQETTQKFARAAGADLNDPSNIMVQLAQDMNAQLSTALAARNRIQQKESASIISNPLDWLTGQLTVKKDYDTYNKAANNFNSSKAAVASLTAATDQAGRTQQGLEEKITDATRAASARIVSANKALEATAIEAAHIADDLKFTDAIANSTAKQAAEVQRQGELIRQARNDAWIQQNYDRAQQREDRADKKQAQADKAEQVLLDETNYGRSLYGLPPVDNWQAVVDQAELHPGYAQDLKDILEAARTHRTSGTGSMVKSPGHVARSIIEERIPSLSAKNDFTRMAAYFKTLDKNVIRDQGYLASKRTKDDYAATFDALLGRDLDKYKYDNVAEGSPYALAPYNVVAGTASSVRNTALYKKVLAPLGSELTKLKGTEFTERMVNLATEAAASKVISWEQAAEGLSEYFGQAVNINNDTNKYKLIGLPEQKGVITSPDISGTDVLADLTNYASVLRVLTLNHVQNVINGPLLLPFTDESARVKRIVTDPAGIIEPELGDKK